MISKFIRKAGKLRDYYKEKGFGEFCRHICVDSIRYDKMVFFERDLSKLLEEVHARIPIKIRLLSQSEKDISRLTEFWPDFYAPTINNPQNIREMIVSRLSAGEECMIAEYEGKITHMNWYGFQNTYLFNPYVSKRGIGVDEFLSYNTYCAPEYRGNRIMNAVHSAMFNLLNERRYKKLITYVGPQNYSSMKVVIQICGKPVKTLHCISLLGFRKYFFTNIR